MIKVITTVGTSLFTNYMRKEVKDYLENNKKQNYDIENGYKALLREHVGRVSNTVKTALENYWIKDIEQYEVDKKIQYRAGTGLNIQCCAEVQTIEKIKEDIIKEKEYEIILLPTNTKLSELAAKIIRDNIYNKEKETRESIVLNGLDVNDSKLFNDNGFKVLFDTVVAIQDENKKDDIILNISGGYKGIIPIMTLIGQLLGIEIVYMYESSNTLIQIAKLPISFDTTLLEGVASYMNNDYLATITRDSELYKYFEKYRLVKLVEDKVEMSGVGQVLHQSLFKGNMSNSILGTFIEYKLYHYFMTAPAEEIYERPQISLDDNQCYKIQDGEYIFQTIEFNDKGKRVIPKGFEELGDLDIALFEKGNDVFVLGEIKSHFQVANDFYVKINSDKDYYKKIKARIEYWKKGNKNIKFLFLIHKIKILQGDFNPLFDEKIKTVMAHFKAKIEEDYQDSVVFDARGIWIDATKKDLMVNYTELFRKPINYTDIEFYSE